MEEFLALDKLSRLRKKLGDVCFATEEDLAVQARQGFGSRRFRPARSGARGGLGL